MAKKQPSNFTVIGEYHRLVAELLYVFRQIDAMRRRKGE